MVLSLLQLAATSILVYMLCCFLLSTIIKRFDIVDIAWGIGFILVAWRIFFALEDPSTSYGIVCILTTLWGIRLSTHIFFRNLGKPEDFRYANWRKEWRKWANVRALFQVFLLQGFFMLVVSFASLVIAATNPVVSLLTVLGVLVWCIGFVFESVGDYQLTKFLKSKKSGEIMQSGLWQYTRHPNYFGEVTQWWGIWIIAVGTPLWFVALVSPITITVLILGVSGIPMLEKKYEGNVAYAAYQDQVSAFFPKPPKKK